MSGHPSQNNPAVDTKITNPTVATVKGRVNLAYFPFLVVSDAPFLIRPSLEASLMLTVRVYVGGVYEICRGLAAGSFTRFSRESVVHGLARS